jgi:hypothetical protein
MRELFFVAMLVCSGAITAFLVVTHLPQATASIAPAAEASVPADEPGAADRAAAARPAVLARQ